MRFPRPLATAVPLLAVLALAACSGDSTAPSPVLRAPRAPTAILNDGSRTGGNPDFFFLPPVVPNPSGDPDFDANAFAGGWKPVVEVCEVNTSDLAGGCVGGTVRTYSGSAVAVSTADQQYQVNIDTKEAWAVAGKAYRFAVLLVGSERDTLGFVDIALLTGSAKNAVTGDLVALQDGRTIPLKFRIERGATVPAGVDVFSETVVTDAGATVLTGGTGGPGTFAILFPNDWLPPELTDVVITVEKVNTTAGNPCTTSVPNLIQSSDCWRVNSYPAIPSITQDLTVAFCPAITPSDPRYPAQVMYKFDAPETLQELENVATTLVNCTPTQIGALERKPGVLGALQYGVASLGRGLTKVFGPNTAYAIDAGVGGRISSDLSTDGSVFSDFFWGIPLRVDVVGGDDQTGYTGYALEQPLSVRVTGAHVHANTQDPPIPISGVPVSFAPGAGVVGASSVTTDANGVASTTWTLGSATGAQSVTASVTSVGASTSVQFGANALATVTSGLALSCGGSLYFDGQGQPGGDLLDRGFHVPNYAGTSLGGVELRLVGAPGTVGTVTLTAYDGSYNGPVLGTTSASFAIPTSGNTPVLFAWPQPVPTTPGRLIAFAMSPAPAGLFYNVANSFNPGDPSCAIIETEDTTPPLSTLRRRGVEASIYATLPVIQ